MQVDKSSFLTLIPYVAMTCMTPFVGPIADGMVRAPCTLLPLCFGPGLC